MPLTAPALRGDAGTSAAFERQGSALIAGNFLSAFNRNRSVCEDLAERLAGAGWHVVTTSNRTGRIARLCDMLTTVWRTRGEYRAAQVDLYSGPAFFWAVAVCWLLRRLGKPYVLTLHGGNLPAFSERWPRWVRRLLRSAAAVTAPSGYLKDALRKFREDIEIVPNAIDLAAYPFRQRMAASPVVVWLRAFHEIYQPSVAVRALALLAREFPASRMIMAGPDKQDGSWEAARALAAELGVTERIEYPGRVAKVDVAAWIDRGDIFLNTSAVDNYPVTLVEAMACGACVVSTQPGGVPYLAKQGVNAILAPVGDAPVLAEGMARVLRDPELAAALSVNARRSVEASDWRKVLPQWSQLLSSLGR